MKRLLNKKTVLILPLTALLIFSLLFFALSGGNKVYAAMSEFVLDANVLSFDGRPEIVPKRDAGEGVNSLFNKGTDNLIIETHVDKENPSVKLKASAYSDKIYGGDNDAVSVEVRLLFNKWPINESGGGFSEDATRVSLKIYNSADTQFENPIVGAEVYKTSDDFMGNFVRTLRMSPEKVCNNRGKLQDFVLRVDSDATTWSSAIIIDYVRIVFATGSVGESEILFAGNCITGNNPENITDTNVIWTKAEGYSDTYMDLTSYGGFYAYVEDPAVVELRKEIFPDVECVSETDGTETLLLKNVVFALDVGNLSADDYKQFLMDILLSDKRGKGDHTLYLYGSNTDKFVDGNGEPVGYAAKITVKNYEQGFHNKFTLEGEDVKKLAGNDGFISHIYVLYHGNTLDTADNTVGIRNGSQIWINKVQFLVEDDVEVPVIGTEYVKYDVSDIFPVGKSARIENKTDANVGNVVSSAVLRDKQVGELSFGLTMSSGDNMCLLFNAKGFKKVNEYLNGGILFYLSNEKIEISSYKGGERIKTVSAVPENAFINKTSVKIICVPYYINSVEAGLYCAVQINGVESVNGYFGSDNIDVGNALHLCYKVKDKDFSVDIASSKTDGIIFAEDLMRVKITAEEIRYSLDRTDIPLSLSWYNTGFDVISEVKCDGNVASVNQETKRVIFSGNGEVKLSYSITNVFGTFESNETSLKCEDVVVANRTENFGNSVWFIVLCCVPIVSFGIVCAVLAARKAKSAKSGK